MASVVTLNHKIQVKTLEGGNATHPTPATSDNPHSTLTEEEKLKLNEGKMVVACAPHILKIKNKRTLRYLVGMENGKGCSPNTKPPRNRTSTVINAIRATFQIAGSLDI